MPAQGTVATAYVQVLPSAEGLTDAMEKVFKSPAEKAGQKSGSSYMQSMGKTMGKLGKTLTKHVTVPLAALGTASIASAATFEESMAKVATIADTSGGKGSASIGKLKSQIMELSNETGISASKIAEASYQAISAGQKTSDAVNFVGAAAKLSKAGFTDLTTATDTLTTALNAYGLKASKVTSVSDKLMTVQNLGKTTIDELGFAMGRVIPTASAFGVNLDNLGSAFIVLTKNGIQTREAGTYINSMLNELGKSGTKASTVLKEKTGKSFKELMESGMDLKDVLKILQDSAEESGLSINDMFGSAEAGKAASSILQHTKDWNGAIKGLKNSAGTTEEAYKKMEATTTAALERMKTSAQNALIALGSAILPIITPMVEKLSGFFQSLAKGFESLPKGAQKTIVVLGGIAAAIGPMLLLGSKVISTMQKLNTARAAILNVGKAFQLAQAGSTALAAKTSMLGTALAGISAPMALAAVGIVTGIAVIIAAVVHLWKTNENFRNAVTAAWNKLKMSFTQLVSALQPTFSMLKSLFTSETSVIKAVWDSFCTHLAPIFVGAFSGLASILSAVFGVLAGLVTVFTGIFTGNWSTAWNGVKQVWTSLWEGIKGVMTAAFTVLLGLSGANLSQIQALFTGFKSTVSSIWNGIKYAITHPVEAALQAVRRIVGQLKSAFNFKWSLPHFNLPHLSVSGEKAPYGIGGKGSLPQFHVAWYKKAMDRAFILSSPTIFGAAGGNLLGGGESGAEVVAGEAHLISLIEAAVSGRNEGGGFTQVINITSPTPLDPSEVARQTRTATRQMALKLRRT